MPEHKKQLQQLFFSLIMAAGIFLPIRFSFDLAGVSLSLTHAAETAWTGAASSDWATAGNWSLNAVPTSGDNVTIPDAAITANDPNISAGAACSNLTIAANGILNGNAQTITVSGNWTNNGAFNHDNGKILFAGSYFNDFIPGASDYYEIEINKWNHNTDRINVIGGAAVVRGNLIHTDGRLEAGQYNLYGNYIVGANAHGSFSNCGIATVNFVNPTNDQTIVYAPGGVGANVRIDKTGGTFLINSDIKVSGWVYAQGAVTGLDTYTLTFGGQGWDNFTPGSLTYGNIVLDIGEAGGNNRLVISGSATVNGNFTHNDGRFEAGQVNLAGNYIVNTDAEGSLENYGIGTVNFNHASNNQTIVYNSGGVGANISIDKTGGAFSVNDNIFISGWTYIQGVVTGLDTNTLTFAGRGWDFITPGNLTYGNIELNTTGSNDTGDRFMVYGTANVSGNFTFTDGRFEAGQINVAGNYIIGANARGSLDNYGTGTVNLNHLSNNQSIACAAGGVGATIWIDKAGGTLSVNSDIGLSGWNYIQGTVSGLSTHTLKFGGNGLDSFTPGSLTYGGIEINDAGSSSYDDVTVSAGTWNISGNLTVTDGELNLSTNNSTVNITGNVVIAAAGTLIAGTNPIGVYGNWTNAGTFNHGDGVVIFRGGTNTSFTPGAGAYHDIQLNKTNPNNYCLTISGIATVSGDLTQTRGAFFGGQINLAGNYVIGATAFQPYASSATSINFNAASDQNIVYTSGGVGAHVRIDKSGGALGVNSDIAVNGWEYVQGTVNGTDSHTLTFGGGRNGTFVPGSLTYYGITINKPDPVNYFVTISGTAKVSGDVTQTDGAFSTGQIDLAGDYIIGASASGGTGFIKFNHATNDQNIIYSTGGVGIQIRVDKTGGTLGVDSDIAISGWEYTRGTVGGIDSHTVTFAGGINGNFVPGSLTYGNIIMNKNAASVSNDDLIVSAGTLTLAGSLTLTDGEFKLSTNNPSINIGGGLTIAALATFTRGTGTVTFAGTAPSTYADLSVTPQNIGKVAVNKTSADESQNKLTLASSLTCDTLTVDGTSGSGDTLDLGSGGYVLTLSKAGAVSDVLTVSGSLTPGTSTVKYAATNSAGSINVAPTTYDSLELSGSETYVLVGDTSIGGNLTIGSVSTLNTATYDLILSGNLNNSGIFVAGSNAVVLDGADQILSGNTTFYDFTKTIAVADALTFQSGSVTTVTHALTLKGESRDNRLTLQSSVPDSSWSLTVDPLGTYDFDSLAVSDSVANRTLASLNSLDQGGNSNWSLINNTAPTVTTPSVSSTSSIATITATLSDNDADSLTLKIEYSLDGGITWLDPYLQSVTASSGSPVLSNVDAYQLSGIPTASSNTLTILWDTTSELNQGGYIEYSNDVKVRLSPYDNTDYGTPQVSGAFTVDNRSSGFIAPAKPKLSDLRIMHEGGVLSFEHLLENIQQVAVSASPDFTDASFQELSSAIDINAYASDTIYLKFRTKRGAVSDVIVYSRNSDTTSQLLNEGDIVKTFDNPDVYIIKYKNNKQYKRLILSPSVFSSYQHLKWDNLKTISQSQSDTYATSTLVQVAGDSNFYELTPLGDTGKRILINPAKSYDADSIYEINGVDRDSYSSAD